jgi:hypothetical protein
MRLQAAPAAPRWLACGHAAEVSGAQQPTLVQHCGDPMQVERLLQERVLDLAVITRPSHAAPAAAADLLELPVLRHSGGVDLILIRRDLSDHQALQALIAAVQQQVRQHLRQHPEQEWLG